MTAMHIAAGPLNSPWVRANPTSADQPVNNNADPLRADPPTLEWRRRHADAGLRLLKDRSTVNPYMWYLHRCKISTGCATKLGSCPQLNAVTHRSSTPMVHIAGPSSRASSVRPVVHTALHTVSTKVSTAVGRCGSADRFVGESSGQ